MNPLRSLFLRHKAWAVLLIAAALCVRALLPAGYMPGQGTRLLTFAVCADASGGHAVRTVAIPMRPGQPDGPGATSKAGGACAFGALAMAAIGGADALLLAAALLFIVALGLAPAVPPPPARAMRLRPPLRGPPLLS